MGGRTTWWWRAASALGFGAAMLWSGCAADNEMSQPFDQSTLPTGGPAPGVSPTPTPVAPPAPGPMAATPPTQTMPPTQPTIPTTPTTPTTMPVDDMMVDSGTPDVDSGVADSGMTDPPNPNACTGRPGMLTGKSNQMVTAGGLNRTFVYYAPADLDPNQPTPLVIVPHGYTMSGQQMYDITGYHEIAEREGFIVIYPDGGPGAGPWNVGANICGNGSFVRGNNDDQAFIDKMIEFVDADRCLDKDHVFVTGFSMGGYFSNETGCQRSDVAAIGPHSGGSHVLTSCPGSKKPVILFHFEGDALIDYSCGAEAAKRWAERNGCTTAGPDMRMVNGGSCAYYKGCPADAQVAFCSFQIPPNAGTAISGHGWAGGAPHDFAVPGTDNASELGWAFFKEFAW